jgi:hypothetical protein
MRPYNEISKRMALDLLDKLDNPAKMIANESIKDQNSEEEKEKEQEQPQELDYCCSMPSSPREPDGKYF